MVIIVTIGYSYAKMTIIVVTVVAAAGKTYLANMPLFSNTVLTL